MRLLSSNFEDKCRPFPSSISPEVNRLSRFIRLTMASKRVQAVSSAFPCKRSNLAENILRAAWVEGGKWLPISQLLQFLYPPIYWSVHCFFKKNFDHALLVQSANFPNLCKPYRSLNDQIDQAQARADDAFTNFEAASKELQSSPEQKKSLTLSGIPDRRASRTVNAGLEQQIPIP